MRAPSPVIRPALWRASVRSLVVFLVLCAANSLAGIYLDWSPTQPFHWFGHAVLLTAGVDNRVAISYVVLALASLAPQLTLAAAVGVVSLALDMRRMRTKRLA